MTHIGPSWPRLGPILALSWHILAPSLSILGPFGGRAAAPPHPLRFSLRRSLGAVYTPEALPSCPDLSESFRICPELGCQVYFPEIRAPVRAVPTALPCESAGTGPCDQCCGACEGRFSSRMTVVLTIQNFPGTCFDRDGSRLPHVGSILAPFWLHLGSILAIFCTARSLPAMQVRIFSNIFW